MKKAKRLSKVIVVCSVSMACSSPQPVLYPNAHLERVGQEAAQSDIDDCQSKADAYGASANPDQGAEVAGSTAIGGGVGAATGAAGGAVVGSAGTGAAVGAATGATAGFFRGLFKGAEPSQTHVRFVEKCLRDRGYEPIGWQ
jgi:hypothetical protein